MYMRTRRGTAPLKRKKAAAEKGVENRRSLCEMKPQKLDPELKTIISEMYMAAANSKQTVNYFMSQALQEPSKA